jgi:hypothetical protein
MKTSCDGYITFLSTINELHCNLLKGFFNVIDKLFYTILE